ncbi:MAG: hypothetical protein AB8H86_23095 [Polyangiales bacterium]
MVDEAGSCLALMPIGTTSPQVIPLPFSAAVAAGLDAICAVDVVGQGTLINFAVGDGEGWTCLLTAHALEPLCRSPWLRSMTYDPQRGVVGAGFDTYVLRNNSWVSLAGSTEGTPIYVEGAGLLGLAFSESGSSMALATIELQGDGGWWTPRAPTIPIGISSASMAYAAADDTVLVVGGQQGPHAHQSERTFVFSDWRAGLQSPNHGSAGPDAHANSVDDEFSVSIVTQGASLLGYDEVSGCLATYDSGRWKPASTPLDEEVLAIAQSTDNAYAYMGRGDLMEWNGSAWRSLPTGPSQPGERPEATFFWDASGRRLILHGGYRRNDTWAHDGHQWALLEGTRLKKGRPTMVSTPAGVYALLGADLWQLRGQDWVALAAPKLPDPTAHLLFDSKSNRLIACGMRVLVLEPAGWQSMGPVDADFAMFAFDAIMSAIIAFPHHGEGSPQSWPIPASAGYLPTEVRPSSQRPKVPAPNTLAAPSTASAKIAWRTVFDGPGKTSDELRAELGLQDGVEVLAVLPTHAEAFPFRAAPALAVVRDPNEEQTRALPGASLWQSAELFELEEAAHTGEPVEWFEGEEPWLGGVRLIPVNMNVGYLSDLDASMESHDMVLRPYRLEAFTDIDPARDEEYDSEPGASVEGTKFGGFPNFIQCAARAMDSNGSEMPVRAQLAEDLYDCTFADAGRLWIFLSEDGQQVDALIQ